MIQELIFDPTAEETGRPVACRFGVLDYTVYKQTVLPLVERARKSSTSRIAMAELKTFLTGLKDKGRREESLTHFERLDAAVQGSRWHRGAAGAILEAGCVDETAKLPDLIAVFRSCSDMFYGWNADHGETLHRFWSFLGDHTIPWASPPDTWRGVLAPTELGPIADVANALTPRDLRKMLTDADRGEVFSPEDAEALSEWWSEMRRIVRLANRQEQGMMVCLKQSI